MSARPGAGAYDPSAALIAGFLLPSEHVKMLPLGVHVIEAKIRDVRAGGSGNISNASLFSKRLMQPFVEVSRF